MNELIFAAFVMIPTIVAFCRTHEQRWLILMLNVVFGVVPIGWWILFAWAVFGKKDCP